MKQEKKLVVRISKQQLENYHQYCKSINSLASIRVKKFIELEIQANKKNKDILKIIKLNEL